MPPPLFSKNKNSRFSIGKIKDIVLKKKMTEAFVQDAYPSFHYAKKMISELFLFNLSFIVFRYKDMVIIMYEG